MTFAVAGTLFAQAGGNGANGADAAAGIGGLLGIMACYAVVIAVVISLYVMFALNVIRTLRLCDPRNRTIEPNQVWLNFIPLFNIVWVFITIFRVSETLEAEFRDRGLRAEGDFGKTNGMVAVISGMVACTPVALIFFIIYWVKMAGYRKQLSESGEGDRERDYDDRPSRRGDEDEDDDRDDEDDRPSRRRRDD